MTGTELLAWYIETAKALGQITQKAEMTIFGDPTTLATMTEKYASAMGLGKQAEGFFAGLGDGAARQTVDKVIGAATDVVSGVGDAARGAGKFLEGKGEAARKLGGSGERGE